MALAAKLQLRQSQALVMTPQLMQSIRLLQLSHVELERFIDEEIERNPLLERVAADDGGDRPEPGEPASDDPTAGDWLKSDLEASAETIAERMGTSLENVFADESGVAEPVAPDLASQWKSLPSSSAPGTDGFDFDAVPGGKPSLRAHIAEQIAFSFASRPERLIADELADNLDEAGYLRVGLTEIEAQLGTDRQTVEAVLATCQTFDPPGIFARDLADCLSIQLRARDRLDPAMTALVSRLDLLARRDFQQLKRICGVDEEDLIDMLAEIRRLDPKPGTAFSTDVADAIVADIIVKPAPDGTWAIELNADTLPRVLVDQTYYARASAATRDGEEREFLSECLQNANWLTRSLDQRARTILKVAIEIVRQQDGFLTHGVRHLRPLNLRTVADAISMHESTVSRVTANKYMLTPRGVFELRYFFTASIAAVEGGESHSSEAVRDQIRGLIEGEAADVLSDDAIVDILKKTGIDIARRTVAKYREAMSIPSSVQRRREKRAMISAAS
ncbi:MAG: RNA polymerase factor sigma-54 [Mesorhizobium sp.]